MNPLNQVNIQEKSTTYGIELSYHSDAKGKDYAASITGIEEWDGRITLYPPTQWNIIGPASSFIFDHSDPDRVIAIAQMMLAFAQMVKNENKKRIDTSSETC